VESHYKKTGSPLRLNQAGRYYHVFAIGIERGHVLKIVEELVIWSER
jgi:hypothetical protein